MRQERRPIFQRFRIRGSLAVQGRGLPSLKARIAHVSQARLICPAGEIVSSTFDGSQERQRDEFALPFLALFTLTTH
jgi:hypothetical protein